MLPPSALWRRLSRGQTGIYSTGIPGGYLMHPYVIAGTNTSIYPDYNQLSRTIENYTIQSRMHVTATVGWEFVDH